MRALCLIRHGETVWNAERRLQGREDMPLSRHGLEQAAAIKPTLQSLIAGHLRAGGDSVTVVVSPLRRARETCVALELTADRVDARWQEADLGEWTGRTREELVAVDNEEYAAWRAGRFAPPGAEPLTELRARVGTALEDLDHLDLVVVITHGGPIRAACHRLVGLDPAHLVPVLPGSLTAVDLVGPRPRLRTYNLTSQPHEELLIEPAD